MQVIRAETAGFCMGVDLALRKLDRVVIADEGCTIFTLGPIIHNPQVLEEYAAKGVQTAQSADAIPAGSTVVIRAHGVPRDVEQQLRGQGMEIVDATCPKVKRAQVLIGEQTAKGRRLLLFGEAEHPEVKGLRSYATKDSIVFESLQSLKEQNIEDMKQGECFLAAQTTQDRVAFEAVIEYLQQRCPDMPVLHTICDATRERQQEALDVAGKVDAMVVVGGFTSGNTRRLVDVAREKGVFCVHVETPEQLPFEKLQKFATIGLTGGASTPKRLIDAIEQSLRQMDAEQ